MKHVDGIYANPNYHPNNHQMRKWLKSLPALGYAYSWGFVLIIPDWDCPVNTKILVENSA